MKQNWILMAVISMLFAGLTSVIAKFGLKNISADTGMVIRTLFVSLFVLLNFFIFGNYKDLSKLSNSNLIFLGISAFTTAISWIFYYRAIKIGEVSKIALIDKGSIVITLILSVVVLKEVLTIKTLIGAGFIISGLLILIL